MNDDENFRGDLFGHWEASALLQPHLFFSFNLDILEQTLYKLILKLVFLLSKFWIAKNEFLNLANQ